MKACHGYLLHEFLSARHRPGRFGGDLAGRSRVLLTIIDRIRDEIPQLAVGVRLSVFDSVPYPTSREIGRPMDYDSLLPYEFGFGVAADDPLAIDLTEPLELMRMLVAHGVAAINLTCGSPYYNPHLQRPAIFPPIDGYQPPEDPLVGVWRQIDTVRQCKAVHRGQLLGDRQQLGIAVPLVGTGYTYLQDYLPHVAQAVVREGWVDFVGLGRMVLSYPELPADTLAGRPHAAQARLPHVQRLHDRAAQRPHLRLLSARPVLQVAARARRADRDQATVAVVRFRRSLQMRRGDSCDARRRFDDNSDAWTHCLVTDWRVPQVGWR